MDMSLEVSGYLSKPKEIYLWEVKTERVAFNSKIVNFKINIKRISKIYLKRLSQDRKLINLVSQLGLIGLIILLYQTKL